MPGYSNPEIEHLESWEYVFKIICDLPQTRFYLWCLHTATEAWNDGLNVWSNTIYPVVGDTVGEWGLILWQQSLANNTRRYIFLVSEFLTYFTTCYDTVSSARFGPCWMIARNDAHPIPAFYKSPFWFATSQLVEVSPKKTNWDDYASSKLGFVTRIELWIHP